MFGCQMCSQMETHIFSFTTIPLIKKKQKKTLWSKSDMSVWKFLILEHGHHVDGLQASRVARWKGSCKVTVLGPDRFNTLTSGPPDVTLRSWHGWDCGALGSLLQSALGTNDNGLRIGLASMTKTEGWRLTMEWTVNKFPLFGKKSAH